MAANLGKRWWLRRDPLEVAAELGELADAAALDPQHWETVFRGIQELVPEGRIAFQAHDEMLSTPLPMVLLGWDDQTVDAYLRHYGAINPWVPGWFKIPTMNAVRSDQHIDMNELRRTEFYNDWLKPIGQAEFATGIKLVHERGRVAQFALHYGAADVERLHDPLGRVFDLLAPRLRRALDSNRAILQGQARGKGIGLLETLLDPAFLVGADRKFVASNAAASKLLEGKVPFRVGAGGLVSGADPETDRLFVKIVDKACARTMGSTGSSEFIFEHPELRLSVAALPVSPNLQSLALRGPLPLFAPRVMALLILRHLPPASADVAAILRQRFGLTASEARVALALGGGGSMVEIAERLGLQYGTARVYLKTAFAKTKTHNQRELLALIVQLANSQSIG